MVYPPQMRRSWALVAVLGLVVPLFLAAPPVGAQEAGEPQPPDDESHGFREIGKMPTPEGTSTADDHEGVTPDLEIWSEGRLGYMATGNGINPNQIDETEGLVAIDLDTFEERARIDLPLNNGLAMGKSSALTIDREGGVIYVAHHNTTGDPDADPGSAENMAECQPNRLTPPCFAGVYVLDARTLELTGPEYIGFTPIGTDAAGVQLMLMGLEYTPRYGGKLHVLLSEGAQAAGSGNGEQEITGRTMQQYAVQIDVNDGRTDWMVPLSGCTGRQNAGTEGFIGSPVIFRSPDPDRPYLWATCWATGLGQAGIVRIELDETEPETPVVADQKRYVAPAAAVRFLADRDAERIMVKTNMGGQQLWWVFDGHAGAFVSRLGIGPFSGGDTVDAIDPSSGRMYTMARWRFGETDATSHPGGLGFTDSRRMPLPQYQWAPQIAREHYKYDPCARPSNSFPCDPPESQAAAMTDVRIAVDPPGPDRPRRVFVRAYEDPLDINGDVVDRFVVFEDPTPVSTAVDRIGDGGGTTRSDDVPEAPGATTRRFLASARGYGLRAIVMNGALSATGQKLDSQSPCDSRTGTISLGLAGSPEASRLASIDHFGSGSAAAQAAYADSQTSQDLDDPYSRCNTVDSVPTLWLGDDIDTSSWGALTGQIPVRGLPDGPGVELPGSRPATCALPDPDPEKGTVGDPVLGGFSAEVTCEPGAITGQALARVQEIGPVAVAGAGSRYRVEQRDGGGVEAHVDSWTRGVSIAGEQGTVTIDGIRMTVTAWANGRSQPEDVADDPNCDTDRTAGSCVRRHFSGVTVVDASGQTLFSCGECSDEDNQRQIVDGIQQALGSSWIVSARDPDEQRAAGADDGAEVSVLKPAGVRFADETLKSDLLPTLPGLELVRISDTTERMGRQIFQFAGVEADLSYGINCLLTVVDGECRGEPTSLEISLTDVDGDALEGGLFRVQPDPDGDGEVSLDETLLDAYACTTGPDGTCTITGMRPGTYVVTQAAAPPGYVPAPDQAIDLPEGGQGRLDVVNGTPSVTGIAISLQDTSTPPQPLEGAEFEVHTGAAPIDAPLATCTTNANGTCEFEVAAVDGIDPVSGVTGQDLTHVLQVPAGPYVLHQSSAPDGYRPVDDVAFDLPEGQIARVNLTNGVVAAGDEIGAAPSPSEAGTSGGALAAEPSPEPVSFQQPQQVPAPQFTINVNVQQEAPVPAPQVAGDGGHTFNVFQNPIGSAKLLLRDPKEAAAFAAAWLLFASAAAAAWRRRMILAQFDV